MRPVVGVREGQKMFPWYRHIERVMYNRAICARAPNVKQQAMFKQLKFLGFAEVSRQEGVENDGNKSKGSDIERILCHAKNT